MKKNLSARQRFESVYSKTQKAAPMLPPQALEDTLEQTFGGQELEQFEVPVAAPLRGSRSNSIQKKRRSKMEDNFDDLSIMTSEELQQEKEFVKIRVTGLFIWKTVLVPPNAYVIHTRRGKKKPITMGLGESFRYNPNTDSYLVVPAAMQTIGIVANCITKEKQGLNVLAYVQWLISDFEVAYQKLDFSDSRNPVAIVNAQLREQAEAAIKDKIATMSVEEVLTDKAPIIEELTARMKNVAEGRGGESSSEGLGLKIVTVQIKEALVSSQSLWQNLQAPFRNEKEKIAKISALNQEEEIHKNQLSNKLTQETRQTSVDTDIKKLKAEKETEGYQIEVQESAQRFKLKNDHEHNELKIKEETTLLNRESERRLILDKEKAQQIQQLEALKNAADLEEAKLNYTEEHLAREQKQSELELALKQVVTELEQALEKLKKQSTLELKEQDHTAHLKREKESYQLKNDQQKVHLEQLKTEQAIMNTLNNSNLKERMIRLLPELASQMPSIDEVKSIQISGDQNGGAMDLLPNYLVKLVSMCETLGIKLPATTPEK